MPSPLQLSQARSLLGLSLQRCPLPVRVAHERRAQILNLAKVVALLALFALGAALEGR